jgi:hypothetical protein
MSKSTPSAELRPLPFIHAVAMIVLAAAWVVYCWEHVATGGLARALSHRQNPPGLDRAFALAGAALGDILLGLCSVFLFAVGTGIYVRRAQLWIDARGSGEAVAYGGADLKDRALAANADRQANVK